MNLSRQSDPRYIELADALRHELDDCVPGDDLPSETQLANRFSVNRHTLRRALDVLVDEGRVVRQQGRRARVLARPIVYPVHAHSTYSKALTKMGLQSEAVLLHRHRRQASPEEARHLAPNRDEAIIELHTLRLLGGQPISLIRHCFATRQEHLLETYRGGSVRSHLEGQNVFLKRVFSLIGAGLPAQKDAAQLLMPQRAAVLNVQTLSSDADGAPFELSYSISRADRFQYQIIPEGEPSHDF
ncbi:GntR family transcriptional regulator [Paralcaligenes sp. KSB-10]|jgi:GntR family phosphonate transport system transcriptional regulator|uniref:GntR family transcriptional regulator n=1 Tax=Paralcaligenes sp. KSB-10 TaxID=2901142 RepID=UPI001E2CA6C0|nr:GntR family transcriptional regulator [Paralcaligenes sp. KSB-10]UHL65017.1 GntR family transcriptional regulator [Paralcaligenes sp. KSB-10]